MVTGTIPITNGQSIIPSSSWFLIGADSNHYVVTGVQGLAATNIKVGCAETNATILTISSAQWATDFDALALGGVPAASAMAQGPIPIQGTKYFYVCGRAGDGSNLWSVGLRYKIESPSSVLVDGAFAYKYNTSFNFTGGLGTCWCYGAAVIDGELFAVCWLYNGVPLFDSTPGSYFLRLPLSYGSNIVESNTAVWPTKRTYIGTVFGDTSGVATYFDANLSFNTCCLLKSPTANCVTVLTYRTFGTLPGGGSNLITAGSESAVVNYSAQTVGALTSEQLSLGQPWADVGLGYAGTPTANNDYNDYSAPSLDQSTGELIFGRIFYDQPTIQRIRRYFYDETTGAFQFRDVNDFLISGTGESTNDRAVIALRDGDDVLGGRYSLNAWFMATWNFPPDTTTTSTGGLRYFIERMDNRIWATIEDAWCVDSALALPQPTPAATLYASSASGSQAITEYNIINGGSGYTAPIGQVIDLNPSGGTGATMTLSISSGIIVTATALTAGSLYRNPELTVLDTTGVGAVIQPIITNLATFTTSTGAFTSSDVGSIIRAGGGKIEITEYFTSTSITGNIISPITQTVPNDPYRTPVPVASGDWTMTAPTTTVSGLDHLENLNVVALADGGVVTGLSVINGAVTLPVAASKVVVGLPFVAQLQTMYMDLGGGPTVQTRRKDVTQVVVRVENSLAPEVGLNQPDAAAQPNQAEIPWGIQPFGASEAITGMVQIRFRTPSMPAGQPQPLVSKDLDITNVFSTWDAKGQIAIQQRDPVPLGVTALTSWVRVGDSTGQS